MKLLIILHETSVFNGAYKSAKILFDGLKAKGVDMLIVTPDKKGAYEQLSLEGFKTICVEGFGYYYWNADYRLKWLRDYGKTLLETIWIAKMLPIVHKFKPDIIYSNSGAIHCGYRLARIARTKHLMHLREFLDKDFAFSVSHIDKMIRRSDTYFISVIKKIAEVRGLANYPRSRTIYNAVNIPNNPVSSPALEDRKYFIFVGNITEGKGTYQLINAYSEYVKLCDAPIPIKFAGGGSGSIAVAKRICNDLGISEYTEFLGKRDDVYELMSNARAVIVPSFFEAFGRVMPEAMINKTLVVARDVAGLKEHFDNGVEVSGHEIGLRFDDNAGLTQALIKATVIDENEYHLMTDGAYRTARDLYSPMRLVNNVYEFLVQIYNNKG